MLTDEQRRFLHSQRVARLATADASGRPHVVPVCFVVEGNNLYTGVDEKPKQDPARELKRIANIRENAAVAVVVDRYREDWQRLGWVMLRGRAEVLVAGREHDRAQALLRARYAQLAAMRLTHLPVIALRIERASAWGNLTPTT